MTAGCSPALCAAVLLPYFFVVPYWNQAPVACPFGFTRPCRVAPTGVIPLAGSVIAFGAAAIALDALTASVSTLEMSARRSVRALRPAGASMAASQVPWTSVGLTPAGPEG